jgi:hypothetical protein
LGIANASFTFFWPSKESNKENSRLRSDAMKGSALAGLVLPGSALKSILTVNGGLYFLVFAGYSARLEMACKGLTENRAGSGLWAEGFFRLDFVLLFYQKKVVASAVMSGTE